LVLTAGINEYPQPGKLVRKETRLGRLLPYTER
jgi:hypothetical protein